MRKVFLSALAIGLLTTMNAQNWNQVNVPTNKKLNDIDFPNNNVGFIVGDEGVVLKTTDGGLNWSNLSFTGIPNSSTMNFIDVEFVNDQIGYLLIDNSVEGYRTTDGGNTWSVLTGHQFDSFCRKRTVYIRDENNLFIGGSDCFMGPTIREFVSTDWTSRLVEFANPNPMSYVTDFDFEGQLGLAATNSTSFLRSVDGGLNWAEVTTTLSDQAVLTEVLIVSPTLIYAGYSDPTMQFGLLKSEDGGVTWNFDINSATFFYPIFWSLAQANDGTIYSGGEYPDGNTGLIFSTEDGINFNYDVVDQPIYSMESIHEDMTWGVGDSGYVVVNVPLAQLGVSETTMEVEMIEIYPNPTSGMIKITGNEIDHIELIDLQMKKVDIEFVPDNSGGFETDLSNLPLGVYFVRSKIGETIKSSKIIKL